MKKHKYLRFIHKDLGYSEHCQHQEYNCNLYNEDESRIGYCKYYKLTPDSKDVYIEYIKINAVHRRKGFGTEIVNELKSKNNLKWDYHFSDEGRKWFDGMLKKGIIVE